MSEVGSYRQIPIKLGWTITIHKSQGQTYESVNLNPNCFCEGQLYVALSRAKDLKKLYITSAIRKNYLKTSEVVKEFYAKIENEQYREEFEEEEEYISIKIPKKLENAVLSLLNGEFDSIVNGEETSTLKRRIKDLEGEIERLRLS